MLLCLLQTGIGNLLKICCKLLEVQTFLSALPILKIIMINLIPSYTHDYDQLWDLIKKRNHWLIQLRYGAVISLISFIFGIRYLLNFEFSQTQFILQLSITLAILFYNVFFSYFVNSPLIKNEPDRFNQMHLALLQMFLDMLALSLLTYYTGGVESPLYIFFIFHMIIGSMILPGYVIYTIAGTVVAVFTIFSLLEYYGIVPHHGLNGLFGTPMYNKIDFIIIVSSAFGIMMVVSVFLANTIASALYRREQELKITLELLSEAEKVKQKYTMGVVHEIKSPIVAVQSFLDLVLQKFLGPVDIKIEEKLSRARMRTDEAIQIINDVLRISNLKLLDKITKEDFDLDEFFGEIISKRRVQAEFKNIGLIYNNNLKEKANLSGDKGMLELAFSNLVGNAVKYTNNGGKIEVVVDNGTDENEIIIEVCDNGMGIPENDQEKIFQEFFRASNVRLVKYEGTGLGLSVVKQIIEQHDGSISLLSPSRMADKNGPGTCFRITLPQ